MKRINKFFMLIASAAAVLTACSKTGVAEGSSEDGYFFSELLSYNLLSNKTVEIPVVRLGTHGDLSVNLTVDAPSIFNVPSSVVIKDGERVANIKVEYNIADVAYNTDYEINVKVSGFKSVFGYEAVKAIVQYPTSYYKYGEGHICENWWAEEEDKDMYARDFLGPILQCYLPDCWGHDTGPGYDVQNYVFYFDTESNKVYVPYQFMGSGTTFIADRGSAHALAAGIKEGTAAWFEYIDNYYKTSGEPQPSFNPATNKFNLSDCYEVTVDGSYEEGPFDTFELR